MKKQLSAPIRSDAIIQRTDLLARLQAAEKKQLIIVKGPGGYGKTTLAMCWRRQLLASHNIVAWIDLAEDDNDAAKLYQYFVSSLTAAGCPISAGIMSLYRKNQSANDRLILQAIADEVRQVDNEIFIFIDDFHFLSRERVCAGIRMFLNLAPPNLHFCLISRTMPRLQLASLEISDQLTLIDGNELRFRFTDVKSFFELRIGRILDTDFIQKVCDATEGWAVAVQMVGISLSKSGSKQTFDFTGEGTATEDVVGHLANETFEMLPAATQEFLKSICILERFCPDLCAHVSGRSDSAHIIDELIQQNYFVIPLESAEGWYRLHHLYSQFLRSRIVDDIREVATDLGRWMGEQGQGTKLYYGPNFLQQLAKRSSGILNVRDLHRRAGHWLSEHGYTADAVTHIVQAGDDEVAVRLLEHCAWDLVAAGRMGYLLACLDGIERHSIDASRILLEAKGFGHFLTCDIDGARHELERLDENPSTLNPDHIFAKEALRSGIALYADHAPACTTVLDQWPPKGHPFVKGAACNIAMWGKIYSGQYSEARILASYARTEEGMRESYFPKVYRDCFFGSIKENEGLLDQAETHYRQALEISEQTSGRRSAPACVAAAYLCGLLYERRQFDECADLVRGRYDLFEQMLLPDGLLRATVAQTRLNCRDGQHDAAAQLIQRLEAYCAARGLNRILAASLSEKARVWLLLGAVDAARETLTGLEKCVDAAGSHEQDEIGARRWMTVARVALFDSSILSEDAVQHCEQRLENAPSVKERIDLALALAQCHIAKRELGKAVSWARTAAKLARDAGFEMVLVDHLIELYHLPESESFFAQYVSNAKLDSIADEAVQPMRPGSSVSGGAGPVTDSGDSAESVAIEKLTAREANILGLVADGHTSREIGQALFISENTVKYHLKNVFTKLSVANRRAAVRKAKNLKMI